MGKEWEATGRAVREEKEEEEGTHPQVVGRWVGGGRRGLLQYSQIRLYHMSQYQYDRAPVSLLAPGHY